PRSVGLHPSASIALVASGAWKVFPEGVKIRSVDSSWMDDESTVDVHLGSGDERSYEVRQAQENVTRLGGELALGEHDAKWFRRQARWILRNEYATRLFDLDLPPTIGAFLNDSFEPAGEERALLGP